MKDHKLQLGRFFFPIQSTWNICGVHQKKGSDLLPHISGWKFSHEKGLKPPPKDTSRLHPKFPTCDRFEGDSIPSYHALLFSFYSLFLNVFQLKIGKPFVGNEKNEGPRIPPPFIHFPLANHEPSIPKIFGYSGMGRLNLS